MTQEFTLTITSKGQTTIPAGLRKLLELNPKGDKLKLNFDPKTKKAEINKPMTIDEIQAMVQGFIKANGKKVEPLLDAKAFYETREARI